MTTAVIIPTLDPDSAMIRTCLQAVRPTEAVVQHDESRDGFSHTCNLGAKQTDADVLVFLNDDTIPQPGWLEALTEHVDDDTIVGGHLLYPDGRTQHSGVFLRRRPVLEAYNRRKPAPSGEVPAVTGACLAITRTRWEHLAGFDEGFVNGYEDVDLCLRHRQEGGRVWFTSECRVTHHESVSPPELRFGHARENIELLQQRWQHLPI